RRATGKGLVQPAAAADDAEEIIVVRGDDALGRSPGVLLRALAVVVLVVIIRAPLGDVAVHVVQSPGVGLEGADLRGLAQVGALFRSAIGELAVEVRLSCRERLAGVVGRRGAGAAGVFPFCLGRQTVAPSGL